MVSSYCHMVSREEAMRIRIREMRRQQRLKMVEASFKKLKEEKGNRPVR